jgi:hypothetical protein
MIKGNGKFCPRTGHKGPEVEVSFYSFFNLGAKRG